MIIAVKRYRILLDENAAQELTKNVDIVELVKVFLISLRLQEKQLSNDLQLKGFRYDIQKGNSALEEKYEIAS